MTLENKKGRNNRNKNYFIIFAKTNEDSRIIKSLIISILESWYPKTASLIAAFCWSVMVSHLKSVSEAGRGGKWYEVCFYEKKNEKVMLEGRKILCFNHPRQPTECEEVRDFAVAHAEDGNKIIWL